MPEFPDKYYLAMSNLCISNPLFKAKLFEYFNFDIEKTFNAGKEDLKRLSEFCECEITIPRDFLKKRDEINPDKIYEDFLSTAEKYNIKYVTYEDEKYPEVLKNIPDFPLMLYYKGSFDGINFNKRLHL